MKGFIEAHQTTTNGEEYTLFLPIDKVGIQANSAKVRILYEGGYYTVSETYAEITAKIEEATEERHEPRQNRSVCINNGMSVEEATGILYDLQTKYVVGGNDSEVIDAIDVAFEAMGGYIPQNHYYRTSDHHPTTEETDESWQMLVSGSGLSWSLIDFDEFNPEYYKFWAPCPKVEVPHDH